MLLNSWLVRFPIGSPQPASEWKEALVLRKSYPVGLLSLYSASLRGVIEDDLLQKEINDSPLGFPVSMFPSDGPHDDIVKLLADNRHEIPRQVKLEDPAGFRPVLRYASYMMRQPLHSKIRPLAFPARIGIIYKQRFEYRHQPVIKDMVNDTVYKLRHKNLAHDGVPDDESDRARYLISPGKYRPEERTQLQAEVRFKEGLARGVALVLSRFEITADGRRQQPLPAPVPARGGRGNSWPTYRCCWTD